MEHYGSSGQLAVTNMETAVIVASFNTNVSALPAAAVGLQLDNGENGTVSDVQAFPGQANVFLIEVSYSSVDDIVSCAALLCQSEHASLFAGATSCQL